MRTRGMVSTAAPQVIKVNNWSLLLGAKAEVVVGILLPVRHRSVRLACLLVVAMVVLSYVSTSVPTSGNHHTAAILVVTGTLAAVAGSRLLAPGGALAAARQVAAYCWMAPLGRLGGAFALVLPIVSVVAYSLNTSEYDPVRLSLATALYAGAVASWAMALAPATGAMAASATAFVGVLLGAAPATDLHGIFENWPLLHRGLVGLWYLLPLHWRAAHLLDTGSPIDALVLSGWMVFGLVVASLVSQPIWPALRRCGAGS